MFHAQILEEKIKVAKDTPKHYSQFAFQDVLASQLCSPSLIALKGLLSVIYLACEYSNFSCKEMHAPDKHSNFQEAA